VRAGRDVKRVLTIGFRGGTDALFRNGNVGTRQCLAGIFVGYRAFNGPGLLPKG
jgi:hypothetical protein